MAFITGRGRGFTSPILPPFCAAFSSCATAAAILCAAGGGCACAAALPQCHIRVSSRLSRTSFEISFFLRLKSSFSVKIGVT